MQKGKLLHTGGSNVNSSGFMDHDQLTTSLSDSGGEDSFTSLQSDTHSLEGQTSS